MTSRCWRRIYRGPAGVIALNDRLQEKLNPPANTKPERRLFGTTFRLGDKVMQTRTTMTRMSTTGILVSSSQWTWSSRL